MMVLTEKNSRCSDYNTSPYESAGTRTRQKRSYPEPPDVFDNGSQNQTEIYNRIVGAIEPKDAERDVATVNKASYRSRELNPDGESPHT